MANIENEIQSPEDQLTAALGKLAKTGVSKLDASAQKLLKFSPESSKLVSALAIALIVAGLAALSKKLDAPAALTLPQS